jgi:hypothetical protein
MCVFRMLKSELGHRMRRDSECVNLLLLAKLKIDNSHSTVTRTLVQWQHRGNSTCTLRPSDYTDTVRTVLLWLHVDSSNCSALVARGQFELFCSGCTLALSVCLCVCLSWLSLP